VLKRNRPGEAVGRLPGLIDQREVGTPMTISDDTQPAAAVEDEDIDAPAFDDLKFRARLLRDANPKPLRHRGKKGDALRELAEIEAHLERGGLSARERIEIEVQLDRLNGSFGVRGRGHAVCSYFGEGPLGAGPFDWRGERRPQGSQNVANNAYLDDKILEQAVTVTPLKGSLGAALRQLVEECLANGRLPKRPAETHIQRLRRIWLRRMG
jgi:hypothetical protein